MNHSMQPEHNHTVRIAVIIPTYNNQATLAEVVAGALEQCADVIVIDDGSTDATPSILSNIKGIVVVTLKENQGKGFALLAGFHKAVEMGFTHAITIDSDAQHLTSDIPNFINKITENPDAVWIGNRVVPHQGGTAQPTRSSFGRRFSNFWFRFNTGHRLHDTQCGFRAYPLQKIIHLPCKGGRYEYEQDVIIKAAWRGVMVLETGVTLHYLPQEKRVSHFRPFHDFLRISKINSQAAITRILLPPEMMEFPGGTWYEKIKMLIRHELKVHSTPHKAAFSISVGVFLAFFPIHGIQILTLVAVAPLLKINRPLAFIGLCASSPPFLPFIIWAAIEIGDALLPNRLLFLYDIDSRIMRGAIEFIVGSIVLSGVLSVLTYAVSFPIFKHLAKNKLLFKRDYEEDEYDEGSKKS